MQAQRPSVKVLLLDGAAIVNMLKPRHSKTFQEYSETVFLPYVTNQLRNVGGVDAVHRTDISPAVLKILHEAREEKVSIEAPLCLPRVQSISRYVFV